jgi:hypothetical protein
MVYQVCTFNADQEAQRTYHWMLGLVMLALKIEIMRNDMLATFVNGCKVYLHIEFSPSLFLNTERWPLEGCTRYHGQIISSRDLI